MEKSNIKNQILKTTCPFCLYGCELCINEINRGDFVLRKIEYDHKSFVNQGRLCARGNAATQILDDKKRLAYPLFNNKRIDWLSAIKQIATRLKTFSAKEIAITYDTNNTIEELTSIFSFAQELNIDLVARSYFEPELFFSYGLPDVKSASLKDISESKVSLVIGDVFSKSPVISKPILDVKYQDRNNRLYFIDSVKNRLAGFANKFVWVKPNTEPILLLGLIACLGKPARDVLGDKNFNRIKKALPQIAETSGVSVKDIEEIVQSLSNLSKGVILASLDFGKTQDPLLLSILAQILTIALGGDKKFCAPALSSVPLGKTGFGDILEQIQQGKVKALINFGDIFPAYYPEIISQLNNLDVFIMTSTSLNNLVPRHAKHYFALPVSSLLEKFGTINTLWAKSEIRPLAKSYSGAKPLNEIIDQIASGASTRFRPRLNYKSNIGIDEIIERSLSLLDMQSTIEQSPDNLFVLGEETAFGYRGIFDDGVNVLKINSQTAKKYSIQQNHAVRLTVLNKEKDFIANIADYVPMNTVLVSVNSIENRQLFPMTIDNLTKEIIIAPTKGILSKLS